MAILSQIAEGGQTWAHRVRMFRQVLKIASLTALVSTGLIFFSRMQQEDPLLLQGAWYHLKARAVGHFSDDVTVSPKAWKKIDHTVISPSSNRLSTQTVTLRTKPLYDQFWKAIRRHLFGSFELFGAIFAGMLLFFFIRGARRKRRTHLSGSKVVSVWRLALRLRLTRKASHLRIGRLPLLKGSETSHTLITGGTGSGKTNCLHLLLPQIRRRGERVVLVDTTGDFVDRYYRKGDTLLNPFSEKGAPWHPWIECRDRFDQEALAESLIPITHCEKENYWRIAARALCCAVLEKTERASKVSDITRWVMQEPLSKLCELLQGTNAAAFVDISSEKTAASIRSVAATYLKCLIPIADSADPFSVRDWVQRPEDDSWLFLHCTPAQRATLKPLLGCWFSVAVRSLMQLPQSFERRLWFVVDELPSLDRIRDLELLLTECRKYGGCGVLSLQSPAQLDAIYGREMTQVILGNCATKIVFAERNPETAQRISRVFGDQEYKEYQEGISYGAHQARDGVSLSQVQRRQAVVSPNDLQSLRPNESYVRLAGLYPTVRVRLPLAQQK